MTRNSILAACLMVARTAHADVVEPQAEPQIAPPALTEPVAPRDDGGDKSPNTALALSLGTTLGGVALVALGASLGHESPASDTLVTVGAIAVAVGPTLGHAYAGEIMSGGLAMRLVGTSAVLVGGLVVISACPLFDPCSDQQKSQSDIGGIIAIGGAVLYGAGLVYEIATVPAAVREHNRERHLDAGITLAPIRTRDGTSPGLALVGRF